jgi:hypothetical protein
LHLPVQTFRSFYSTATATYDHPQFTVSEPTSCPKPTLAAWVITARLSSIVAWASFALVRRWVWG